MGTANPHWAAGVSGRIEIDAMRSPRTGVGGSFLPSQGRRCRRGGVAVVVVVVEGVGAAVPGHCDAGDGCGGRWPRGVAVKMWT
ncbi:hypothetical protein E2C01_060620 [Portunus trituberculatus]|uniref:Uncharacterized protein n=1 Tax=Portunus trituberculatus TaxID=210409 RepID=A0A5B7H5Z8_PORTR|nr:hypothetical protein [Portunus trituberculatus]